MRYASLLKVASHCLSHQDGGSRYVHFQTAQQVNFAACSSHCPFNAERHAGKLRIPILKSLV